MKGYLRFCCFSIAAVLCGAVVVSSYGQDVESVDINALELEAKSSLNWKAKLPVKEKLLRVMASDAAMDVKNRVAVRLAEIMIYSPGSLEPPQSLLENAMKLIPEEEFALRAEAEYLLGLIDYVKSQVKTRSIDNEVKRLKERGEFKESDNPFADLAVEHFDAVLKYPECDAVQKALVALKALADPHSFEGFLFFNGMGQLFDDNSRLNTFVVGQQYYRVIEAYERGETKRMLDNGDFDEASTVGILSDLSLAYFTTSKFEKALETNQKGLDLLGKTDKTGVLKFNRAFVYKYISKKDNAEKEFDDLLNDFPLTEEQFNVAALSKAKYLIGRDEKQEAKRLLKEVAESQSESRNKERAKDLLDQLN